MNMRYKTTECHIIQHIDVLPAKKFSTFRVSSPYLMWAYYQSLYKHIQGFSEIPSDWIFHHDHSLLSLRMAD